MDVRVYRTREGGRQQRLYLPLDQREVTAPINCQSCYNSLGRSEQKELLRQMVERVIVNPEATIQLDL